MIEENIIICRCENISLAEIKNAIKKGARDISSVKKITRAGMGRCQGHTCEYLIKKIIDSEIKNINIDILKKRPPIRPIKLIEIAGVKNKNGK